MTRRRRLGSGIISASGHATGPARLTTRPQAALRLGAGLVDASEVVVGQVDVGYAEVVP